MAAGSDSGQLEARLRRAETLVRIAANVRYDVPLTETLHGLAATIVEETQAAAAGVALINPEDLTTMEAGTVNLPEGYVAGMDQTRQNPERGAAFRLAVAENRPWIIRDSPRTLAQHGAYGHMIDIIKQLPPTLVASPFLKRPEIVGLVYLYYPEGVEVDDDEMAFACAVAAQVAPVMDNAWLHNQAKKRMGEFDALFRADEALRRSLRLEDVEEAMVDLAIELLGASSSLVVAFDDADRLAVQTSRGITDFNRDRMNARYQNRTRAGFIGREVRAVLIEDLHAYERVEPIDFRQAGPRSLAELPVWLGDELWGFVSIGWIEQRRFSDDDRRLFDAFTSRASLAIHNAILFEQGQMAASNEERQRLARDLHDSVSQALYGIALGARTARKKLGQDGDPALIEPVDYIVSLAEAGLAETRALIFELIPESLETQGLVVALERQAAAMKARHQIDVIVDLCDEPELHLRVKEALYRIAQESLNNIAKHAGASQVWLSLRNERTGLTLGIRDNGRGFDTGANFPGHFGLQSMAERARKVGGSLVVESRPGEGTTVVVFVPRPLPAEGIPNNNAIG